MTTSKSRLLLSPASTATAAAAVIAILVAATASFHHVPFAALSMSLSTRFRRELAKNFRSPGPFNPLGWFAARMMKSSNIIESHEMIDLLLQDQKKNLMDNKSDNDPTPTTTTTMLVELGPGNGLSMEYLLQQLPYNPKDPTPPPANLSIHAFEISERFRNTMKSKFADEIASGLITIHGRDAKELLSATLPPNSRSITAIYGTNVVYFLDPLDEYLQVFYQALQPDGLLLLGVDNIAATSPLSNTPEFANTDWATILEAMRRTGFVEVEQRSSTYPGKAETTFFLLGKKPTF